MHQEPVIAACTELPEHCKAQQAAAQPQRNQRPLCPWGSPATPLRFKIPQRYRGAPCDTLLVTCSHNGSHRNSDTISQEHQRSKAFPAEILDPTIQRPAMDLKACHKRIQSCGLSYMHICICICIVYIYVCIICMYIYMYIYVCMYVYVYVCMYVCM